jgi:hypothetical protein
MQKGSPHTAATGLRFFTGNWVELFAAAPAAVICIGGTGAIPCCSRLENIGIYFMNSRLLAEHRVEGTFWGSTPIWFIPSIRMSASRLSAAADSFRPHPEGNR